jgi:hypothetical protein
VSISCSLPYIVDLAAGWGVHTIQFRGDLVCRELMTKYGDPVGREMTRNTGDPVGRDYRGLPQFPNDILFRQDAISVGLFHQHRRTAIP